MKLHLFWTPAAVALLSAGCATDYRAQKIKTPPKTILEIKAAPWEGKLAFNNPIELEVVVPQKLNIATAMGLALKANPELTTFSAEIRARDAAVLQAGLLPNPELMVDFEDFLGQGELSGFDGLETTVGISQLIELGGKRGNRQRVAAYDKNLAEWDYLSKKLNVLAATGKAFIEVLVAQEQVALNHKLFKLAEQTTAVVKDKVDSGKEPPVELTRSRVELAVANTELIKSKRKLAAAKRQLASFWGAENAEFIKVIGKLNNISPLPPESALQETLKNNPDLARWKTEIKRSNVALDLANSEAIPDITISAGARNYQESGSNAFLVGFSIPIPIFNRNQGGIAEAEALIDKAQSEQPSTTVELVTNLSSAWQTLSAAYIEAVNFRDEILPNAQAAYNAAELGYSEGKLDFLQMLDAQRTYFTVKRQLLTSLGEYHLARTDVERLTGVSASKTVKTKNERI